MRYCFDCTHKITQSSRLLLAAELSHLATEKNSAQRDLAIALSKQQNLAAQHKAADAAAYSRIAALEEESGKTAAELAQQAGRQAETSAALANTSAELAQVQAALASERKVIDSVLRSLSWHITEPLRATMMLLRGRPRGGKQP